MKREKTTVRIGFDEIAEDVSLLVKVRRAFEAAENPSAPEQGRQTPDTGGVYGRRLLRPSWLAAARTLVSVLGRWGEAEVSADGTAAEFKLMLTPAEAAELKRLAGRHAATAMTADISEQSLHPLAGSGRRKADEAADSLLAFTARF